MSFRIARRFAVTTLTLAVVTVGTGAAGELTAPTQTAAVYQVAYDELSPRPPSPPKPSSGTSSSNSSSSNRVTPPTNSSNNSVVRQPGGTTVTGPTQSRNTSPSTTGTGAASVNTSPGVQTNTRVTAPTRTGNFVAPTDRTVTTGRLASTAIPRQVTGSYYQAPGSSYRYVYAPASYYRTIPFMPGTLYPLYGTAAYWSLLNNPYYYPNYNNFASPWYHHGYPVGYSVQNGAFVPVAVQSSHSGVAMFFLWVLWVTLAAAVIFAIYWWFVIRPRKRANAVGSYGDQF